MARTPQSASGSAASWLTLTDLGRLYGISAIHCGRLLEAAGLRLADGRPSQHALRGGYALVRHPQPQGRQALWHRDLCRSHLEQQGLELLEQTVLVQQWANLLSALDEGSPSISTSAAQMAEDLPGNLIEPVNRQLRAQGCGFQIRQRARLHNPNQHQAS